MSDLRNIPAREKSRLLRSWTWRKVIRCFGLTAKTTSSGFLMLKCVFHSEKTPSLKLRPNGSFWCYGCMANGDMFKFVVHMLEVDCVKDVERKLSALKSTIDVPGQLYFPFHESWKPWFSGRNRILY